jgi:hypothetical protein
MNKQKRLKWASFHLPVNDSRVALKSDGLSVFMAYVLIVKRSRRQRSDIEDNNKSQ